MTKYLVRATVVSWAVVLIDDDGVLDIPHHDVLEENVGHKPIAGPGPCLYSHSIVRSTENCIR